MSQPTTKAAATPLDLATADHTKLINDAMADRVKQIFIGAMGAGAVGRGLRGLYNTGRRNFTDTTTLPSSPVIVVPTGRNPEQEEDNAKFAAEVSPEMQQALARPSNWLSRLTQKFPFNGSSVSGVGSHPLFGPLGMTAALGGAYGGWKLTDWLLDKPREAELNADLASSQEQFEQALQPSMASEASPLGRDLDRLYQRHGHRKTSEWSVPDVAGTTSSFMLSLWPLLALGSGATTYNMLRGQQKQQLLQDAVRRRHQQQLISSPVYAVPEDIVAARPAEAPKKLMPPKEELPSLQEPAAAA